MVETVLLDSDLGEEEMSTPERVYRTTYATFRECGYPVSEGMHMPPVDSGLPDAVGITPRPIVVEKSNELGYTGRNQVALFKLKGSLENQFEGHAGAADGVTALHVAAENSIEETLFQLEEQGLLKEFITDVYEELKPSYNPTEEQLARAKQNAIDIAAYTTATFAKGWLAEAVLAGTNRFEKGSPDADSAGRDLYDRVADEWVQLKTVTHGYRSRVTDRTDEGIRLVYYQWNCAGELVYGEEHTEVNAAANVRDLSKTLLARTHSEYKIEGESDEERSYRYLWW